MAFANRELAGLPSSAQLYLDDTIDLNAGLIIPGHEASTFVLWVRDRSMIQAGIFDGDWIVVDRELVAKDDDVVVAVFNNAFTIKRLGKIAGKVALLPENPHFKPIVKEANDTLEIWGVVTNCLRRLQRHVAALRASTDCEH